MFYFSNIKHTIVRTKGFHCLHFPTAPGNNRRKSELLSKLSNKMFLPWKLEELVGKKDMMHLETMSNKMHSILLLFVRSFLVAH